MTATVWERRYAITIDDECIFMNADELAAAWTVVDLQFAMLDLTRATQQRYSLAQALDAAAAGSDNHRWIQVALAGAVAELQRATARHDACSAYAEAASEMLALHERAEARKRKQAEQQRLAYAKKHRCQAEAIAAAADEHASAAISAGNVPSEGQ